MKERDTERHESFGKIKFNRFTCNHYSFFGTDVSSNGGISIEITGAYKERRLHGDNIFSGKSIAKVEMSYNQFYEAIGAMMNTDGVPCTLKWMDGKYIKSIEHEETKQEIFQREFDSDVKRVSSELNDIVKKMTKMSEGKSIKKTEFKALLCDVEMAKQAIGSNLPFVLKQFTRSLNKSVKEAKSGFAGFIESKVYSLGLKKLKEDQVNSMLEFKGEK